MKKFFLFLKVWSLLSVVCCLSSCIRLTGFAGYSKQGPEDELPKTKQVGFDTGDLIPNQNQNKGNIQMGENS